MGTIFKSIPYTQSTRVGGKYKGTNEAKNLSNILEPNGSYSDLNIINKFNWTLTPLTNLLAKEIPYIKLTEYYLTDSYLNQLFRAYGRSISSATELANAFLNPFILNGSSTQLYEGLYDHLNPSGFTYKFPYFTDQYLNTSNSWVAKPFFQESVALQKMLTGYGVGIVAGGLGLAIGGTAVVIGKGLGALGVAAAATGKLAPIGAPAALAGAATATKGAAIMKGAGSVARGFKGAAERLYEIKKLEEVLRIGFESPISNMQDPAIDKPFIWSTTSPRTFNISFPLYNIMTQPEGTNWQANIIKNWELCHLLCYQNLYNKRNLFTGIPPVFYEIDIPGIHYTKAGYVNNLQILNVGNIRKLTLPLEGGTRDVNVPDAYIVNMNITDFFIPSKNFMSSLCNKTKGILTNSNFEYEETDTFSLEELQQQTTPYGGGTRDIPGDLGCWVAREVYGVNNYKWIIFRNWLYYGTAPNWLQKNYTKYGKQFAKFISNKPILKYIVKFLMNIVTNKYV